MSDFEAGILTIIGLVLIAGFFIMMLEEID